MGLIINPYAFATNGPPGVPPTIGVDAFGAGGTGNIGAFDYTTSVLSGVTPKAALLLGSGHNIVNDNSGTGHVTMSLGILADNMFCMSATNENGNATTHPFRFQTSSYFLNALTGGFSTISERATGTLISGGIRLTYDTNNATNNRYAWAAFGGVDTQAKSGTIALGTGTSAIAVSDVGFEPDVVILIGACRGAAAADANFAYSIGAATKDGTQRCVLGAEANGAANSEPLQAIRNDYAGGQIANTTGALDYGLLVSAFNGAGFSVTPSASAGSDSIGYLALKLGGRVKIVDLNTPTSTGNAAITGAGFEPQFALSICTLLEAVNSHPGATSALMEGLSISFIGANQRSAGMWTDSGNATTSCQNIIPVGNSAITCFSAFNQFTTTGVQAALTSFDADGLTLNYSVVQAAAKKGFMVLFE